jgi:hypothetical protein
MGELQQRMHSRLECVTVETSGWRTRTLEQHSKRTPIRSGKGRSVGTRRIQCPKSPLHASLRGSQFRYGTYSRRYPLSITCTGPDPVTANLVANSREPCGHHSAIGVPLLLKPQQVNCLRIATFIETDIRICPVGLLRCSQPGTPSSCMQCQGTHVMELITLMVL